MRRRTTWQFLMLTIEPDSDTSPGFLEQLREPKRLLLPQHVDMHFAGLRVCRGCRLLRRWDSTTVSPLKRHSVASLCRRPCPDNAFSPNLLAGSAAVAQYKQILQSKPQASLPAQMCPGSFSAPSLRKRPPSAMTWGFRRASRQVPGLRWISQVDCRAIFAKPRPGQLVLKFRPWHISAL